MYPAGDENKYKNLIDDLKNLKKIEAPVGFEHKLWNKINSRETVKERSLWSKISIRLVPATAVLATAVALFIIIDNNAYEYQDPFLIEPEERKDIVEFSSEDITLLKSEGEQPKEQLQEKSSVRFRKKEVETPQVLSVETELGIVGRSGKDEDSVTPELPTVASSMADEVDGNEGLAAPAPSVQQNLNFRQIQLSKEEQREVIELKNKILKADHTKEK
ncbi:MAG: hypothetical protein MUO34_12515 [Ignavibacteriaceae bacterium]|nr:hypothetical protein [Ignavibacteriaceae bacterium]